MVLLIELLLNEPVSKSKQLSHSCTVTIICSFLGHIKPLPLKVNRNGVFARHTSLPSLFSVTSMAVEAWATYERCSKFRQM